MIITIDGPAASGKSTTAQTVSKLSGMVYMDSGLMYRGVALGFIKNQIKCSENSASEFLPTLKLNPQCTDSVMKVYVDNKDVTSQLYTSEVTKTSSRIAKLQNVRDWLLGIQRGFGDEYRRNPGIIAVGRDMGTVVFRDADQKFFVTASIEVRVQRRVDELQLKGVETSFEEVHDAIVKRDHQDTNRKIAPLRKASEAIVINTDHLGIDQQAEVILKHIREHHLSNDS